jgi:small GTP-binding protein
MEKKINVITLGAAGVGKTSIIMRIKNGTFTEEVKTTINVGYFIIKKPYQKKNLTISLQFYDTAGGEQFENLLPKQYIRDSHIVLLVFSDVDTLNDLNKRWFRFYKENCNIDNSRFILIANKSDTFGEQRKQIIKCGEEFSQEINAHFITCSAKNEDNMDNLERYILTEAKRFIDEEDKKQGYSNIHPIEEKEKFSLNREKIDDKKLGKESGGCICYNC